jgi:hypothetical protein
MIRELKIFLQDGQSMQVEGECLGLAKLQSDGTNKVRALSARRRDSCDSTRRA